MLLSHGVSSGPLACCLSLSRAAADMWLCAAAREGTGGPQENLSQRAGQLDTSSSNHPAARLNLQLCSAVRLKEAAWRANLSVA